MSTVPPRSTHPPLAQSVRELFGVGPERCRLLEKLDVISIEDLLLYPPRRYEDRSKMISIYDLRLGQPSITRGKVVALGFKYFRQRQRSVFELILEDSTARLYCRWWNSPWMENVFNKGDEVVVFGKLRSSKPRAMDHPETEVVESGEDASIHMHRITPIYGLTDGLSQRWLRSLIWRSVSDFKQNLHDPWPRERLSDLVDRRGIKGPHPFVNAPDCLPTRAEAVRQIHFPDSMEGADFARQRLALDEFVTLQQQMRTRRRNLEAKAPALNCSGDNTLIKPFLARLPFKLTEAQTKVLRELRKDMTGPRPMRRLLQGDVGSGKTAVAACCALMSLESGYNVAFMAPTELLAEQHYRNFSQWFEPLGPAVELHTGSRKIFLDDEKDPYAGAASAQRNRRPCLFIGTHALISDGLRLPRLGLVIIDEQHKFGVTQREQLLRKGNYPHLLFMTATPIPRTLGLTFYGDLDTSLLDKLPPGRGTVKTFVRSAESLPKVWGFIRKQLTAGRQAYVVYPRVEDTGSGDTIKAVLREFEKLAKELKPFKVGVVHGRLQAQDRDLVMTAFRENSIHVLLATSLIEVGLDVPNATIMMVENAEQFGLAQLHQLRGRIGRGRHDAFCILVGAAKNKEAWQRLQTMAETNDGFRIAEADMKFRGPGELLGQQQSGLPKFRFGDLNSDLALILLARQIVADP